VPVLLAEISDLRAAGFEDPQPEEASIAINAKSLLLADSRAVVSRASNCRCPGPRVGESVECFRI
jgi:hypothetical protein